MTSRVFAWLLAAPFLATLTRGASAQTSSPAELRGRVREATDSTKGIAGVEVELMNVGSRTRTDSAGHYVFSPALLGSFTLRARLVGYEPYDARVNVDRARTTVHDIALKRSATTLSTIEVRGRTVTVPPKYAEIYARGAKGSNFFTREEIEARNPPDVKSLLGGVSGVQVNDRGITFQRCQGGLPTGGSGSTRPANVQVYIDGKRVTRGTGRIDAGEYSEADAALKLVVPSQIQAMEVYTGVARIPAAFNEDACAVIAIWTKAS